MPCQVQACGLFCYCDLPFPVVARSTAKTMVVIYSTTTLVLAAALLAIAALGWGGDVSHHFLSRTLPRTAEYVLLAAGAVMFCVSLIGCCSIWYRSTCLLGTMISLTLTVLTLAALATALIVAYDDVVRLAGSQSYVDVAAEMDWLTRSFYDGVRAAFEAAYEDCHPLALSTSDVNHACAEHLAGDECTQLTEGRLGLFCRSMPDSGPFEFANTFRFPGKEAATQILLANTLRSAAGAKATWAEWVNFCAPTDDMAASYLAAIGAGRSSVPASPSTGSGEWEGEWEGEVEGRRPAGAITNASALTAEGQGGGVMANFKKCYQSTWWGAGGLSAPDGWGGRYPNGSKVTDAADARFFKALGNGSAMSPKLAFCLCAAQGEQSALAEFLRQHPSSRVVALALVLAFLALTLLSEAYLCCRLRQRARARRQAPDVRDRELQSVQLIDGASIDTLSAWPGTSVRHR